MHSLSHSAHYLGDLSKQLVVISLLEVDLVIDSISHLSLIPFLFTSSGDLHTLPSFR